MFRRTIVVFLLMILVALLATALYAAFGLSNPKTALAEAEQALQQGRNRRAIALLDLTERSGRVADQPELQQQLLRLRCRVYRNLGDAGSLKLALRDIEQLLAITKEPSPDLLLDRIWLLASTDQGEQALQRSREFLRQYPDDGRALELCGDACRVLYASELKECVRLVRRDLGGAEGGVPLPSLLAFLYRPDGDLGVEQGLQRLAQAYRGQSLLQPLWLQFEPRLLALRKQIQIGLDYYRQSLEQKGEPVSAFQGLAFALGQSGRADDLVAQSLLYMRRFDNIYAGTAAGIAAAALLREGMPRAAVAVADAYLPSASIPGRLQRGELTDKLAPLLLTKALALWQLQDRKGLGRLSSDCWQLWQNKVLLQTATQTANGLVLLYDGKIAEAERDLGSACEQLARSSAATADDDPLAVLAALRLDIQRRLGAEARDGLAVLDQWQQARPDSIEPLLARARFHLQTGAANAALTTLAEARQRDPRDETVLRLLAEANAEAGADNGQGGDELLQQCLRLSTLLPDVAEPTGYLLCAEAALRQADRDAAPPALRQTAAMVARRCADKAIDRFPWSRWPRLLLARAELRLGRSATAVEILDALAAARPDDAAVQQLRLHARSVAGVDATPALAAAMQRGEFAPGVQKALLREALPNADRQSLRQLIAAVDANTQDPELLALLATAQAGIGDGDAAAATLQRGRKLLPDQPDPQLPGTQLPDTRLQEEWCAAAAAVLATRLQTAGDAGLREQEFLQWLPEAARGGAAAAAAWLRAAHGADRRGNTTAAWLLADAALQQPGGESLRGGASYLFAGTLALRLGRLLPAQRSLTAALSFADGVDAAEPLARLWLLQQRLDKAAAVMALQPDPQDPALLLLLDRRDAVLPRLRAELARDPGDLLAHCTMALATQVAPSALGAGLGDLGEPQRSAALQLLSILRQPELGSAALPLARALAEALPQSDAVQLLLARALLQAGLGKAAARLHAQLAERGVTSPLLFAEAVRAARQPDYEMPPSLLAGMPAAAAQPDAPPCLGIFLASAAAMQAQRGGYPAIALEMLATIWAKDPLASDAGPADADLLFRSGRTADALALLTRLMVLARPEQRSELAAHLFQMYELVQDDRLLDFGRRQALTQLEADPSADAALQFLLRDQARRQVPPALQLAPERARQLLLDQIRATDDVAAAARGIELLLRDHGDELAAATAAEVLQHKPWATAIWVLHAQSMARLQQAVEAVGELRAVRHYLGDPWLDLASVELAAVHRSLADGDEAQLAALPDAVLQSPQGHRVRGLMALRRGDGAKACAELQSAPAMADGSHLYFRALGELLHFEPASLAAAQQLFERLAADYPSSSLARYAGSFARQLASR